MILYTKRCLACTNRQLWKWLRQFAKVENIKIEERRVTVNRQWLEEAESYEVTLPFIVYNGVAKELSLFLEENK